MEPDVGDLLTRPRLDGKGDETLRVAYVGVGPWIAVDGKGDVPGITFVRVERQFKGN